MSSQATKPVDGASVADPASHKWLKFYDPEVPAHLAYPRIPIYQLLDDTAAKHPDRTLAIFFGKHFTYARIDFLTSDHILLKSSVKCSINGPNGDCD